MATTTNYGWTTPDDTSLVKDGAAAIRTLGSSVDTTTKNLNPQTTTGALAFRSATSNVNTALPIGTAGQLLAVNSGATAPEWQTISTGSMTLLSTTTLTGSTVNITSINQSYKKLVAFIKNPRAASSSININLRYNNISTATYSSTRFGSTDVNSVIAPADTSISFMPDVPTSASTGFAVLEICDYANTGTIKMATIYGFTQNNSTPGDYSIKGSMNFSTATSAITELNFFKSGGGTFDSGTVELYGVK
jgi:hypothetical protein